MDEFIYIGDEVKATQLETGGIKLGGYLVRFSNSDEIDLTGDYFTKSADYGDSTESVVWFNHRLPVKLKKHNVQVKYTEPLGRATLKKDDIGVFAEVVIEARNEYEKTIAELAQMGKLSWSSGTASHLVDRKAIKNGVTEITRWPLGLDASLTPTPAEPRASNQVLPIKSLIPSDAALSDVGETKTNQPTTQKGEKIMEDEIKSAVDKAVADALAAKAAQDKAEADRAAEIKAAEEKAYKQALEDMRNNKAPAFNTKTELGFSEEKDAVPAFKHWMSTGQINGGLIRPDSTWSQYPAAKGAGADWNVTTGASGAFLVPDPLYAQIIAKRNNQSWVRQVPCQYFETTSDHLLVPREDTSHTAFVQTAEGVAYDENEGEVGQKDLILYKFTKETRVNEEFLMYQSTNWEAWFAGAMGRAVAATENSIFTDGVGTTAPEGVLVGATNSNVTTATVDVILPSEMASLIGSLGAGYNVPSECAMLMANVTKWYLKGTTLSAGGFAYISTPAGGDFFGYNAIVDDDLDPYTTNSGKPILFGNFNYYGVVERPGMIVQRNPYLYMANGKIGIFCSIFRGGGVLQSEAFYYLNNKAS